jgi:hypothetical protein
MALAGFQVGERVKLRSSFGNIPAGMLGTVERAFRSIDAYEVQFDGHLGPQLVWGRKLERITKEPEKEKMP